jgi:hypothetical protein
MAGGSYPRISRGLGELTPSLWDRLMTALEFVEREGPTLQRLRPDRVGAPAGRATSTVLARITSSTLYAPRRWRYGWTQAQFDAASQTYSDVPDGIGSGVDGFGFAYNTAEATNTPSVFLHGIGAGGPPGSDNPVVNVIEIPTGDIVIGSLVPSESDPSVRVLHFVAPNAISVFCPEPSP